jgi:hypothetical protein
MKENIKLLVLTRPEQVVLDTALEFYVRLGLGQFSEIGTRFRLLTHDRELVPYERIASVMEDMERDVWAGSPWRVNDRRTGMHTVVAFLLQARLRGNDREQRWAYRRIHAMRRRDSI